MSLLEYVCGDICVCLWEGLCMSNVNLSIGVFVHVCAYTCLWLV